jgi:hypothetical protein|tara:strand:- start:5470 stop:5961 length:492 start_codon:yes stop_codon:yes gene_type:complete
MNKLNFNILSILATTCVLFLSSCGGGGGSSDVEPVDTFNIDDALGVWLFNANCDQYILGSDTVFLDEELPDSITVFSNSDNTLFIEAGDNNLNASVDQNGHITIDYQSFETFLELGSISDTATIYLTGSGFFNSSTEGNMDLTFTEPNLPGEINCVINLTRSL